MSARDELYALAVCGNDRTADAAIDAYRAETRHNTYLEAADQIEAWQNDADDRAVHHHGALTDTETAAHIAVRRMARALREAAGKDAKGAPASAPDFFQPGHGYTHLDGHDFLCVAVTTHPRTGWLYAMGWISEGGQMHRPAVRDINHWRHEYDGCQPPTEGEVPRG